MDELGSILNEARSAHGLTLEQVESELRIRSKFLAALEEGRYDALPTAVHARGYLKNYARFLGLDPEPLLARYEVSKNYQAPPIPTNASEQQISTDNPIPSRTDSVFFNPVNLTLDGKAERRQESFVQFAIIGAVLIFLGLLGYRFLNVQPKATDDVSEVVATVNAGVTVPAFPSPANGESEGDSTNLISTSRNNPENVPTATPRPTLPAILDEITLQLEITERSWVRVTIDDAIVFQGQVRQGENYEWTALQSAHLEASNGIGIFVIINGTRLGRYGGRQDSVDEIWTTNN